MYLKMEDRSWAVGLSQTQFEIAYQQRFPHADVFPTVESYLHPIQVEERGIDPFISQEEEVNDGKVELPGIDKPSPKTDNPIRDNRRVHSNRAR